MSEVGDIETRNGRDYRYNGARWVLIVAATLREVELEARNTRLLEAGNALAEIIAYEGDDIGPVDYDAALAAWQAAIGRSTMSAASSRANASTVPNIEGASK